MLRLGLSYQHRAMPYGLLLTEDWPEFTQDADRRALEPQGGGALTAAHGAGARRARGGRAGARPRRLRRRRRRRRRANPTDARGPRSVVVAVARRRRRDRPRPASLTSSSASSASSPAASSASSSGRRRRRGRRRDRSRGRGRRARVRRRGGRRAGDRGQRAAERRGLRGEPDRLGDEPAREVRHARDQHEAREGERDDGGSAERAHAEHARPRPGEDLANGAGTRRTRASAPPPGAGSNVTSPPQRRASSRAIASPRPVPETPADSASAAAVEALEHGLLLARARGPGPWSRTLISGPSADELDRRARARRRSRSRAARRGCGPGRCDGTRRASRAAAPAATTQLAARCRRGRGEALGGALDRGGGIGRRGDAAALAGAAQLEQLGDDLGEAVDLAERRVEVLGLLDRRDRLGARLLQAQAQARRAACAAGARRRRRTRAGPRAASPGARSSR